MAEPLATPNVLWLVISIFLCSVGSFRVTNGLTIKLIRRDEVESDLFPKNLSAIDKHRIYADLAHSRAYRFAEQAMKMGDPTLSWSARNLTRNNTVSPKLRQLLDSMFVIPITIGSRLYRTHLLFDTGSDFVWVQCQPCENCFQVRGGPFEPKRSSSYRPLPFNSPLCQRNGRFGDLCSFRIEYPTSRVSGITSLENVQFTTIAGRSETIPNFLLGCTFSAPGIHFSRNTGQNNPIAGIFGIAMGIYRDSFMSVTQSTTKWKFSFCLPPWSAPRVQTNLRFGDDVQPLPRTVQTTPLQTVLYTLNCLDISVAGILLHLDPSLFRPRPDGTGGLIMDTGTAASVLVPQAYSQVKAAFTRALWSYMKPGHPVVPYELCYSWPVPPGARRLPALTYHLQHADLEIEFWNVFQTIEPPGGRKSVCMMMLPDHTNNILGAVQQANYRFVHNLMDQSLSFYPEKCTGN